MAGAVVGTAPDRIATRCSVPKLPQRDDGRQGGGYRRADLFVHVPNRLGPTPMTATVRDRNREGGSLCGHPCRPTAILWWPAAISLATASGAHGVAGRRHGHHPVRDAPLRRGLYGVHPRHSQVCPTAEDIHVRRRRHFSAVWCHIVGMLAGPSA